MMLFAMMMLPAAAQSTGKSAVGIRGTYGNEFYWGIGANYRYGLGPNMRVEGTFDYFLKHEHVSMAQIGLNLHYVVPVTDVVGVYPLAGISYNRVTAHFRDLKMGENVGIEKVGVNVGGGIEFAVAPQLLLHVEAKLLLIQEINDQLAVSVGLVAPF